MKKARPIIEIDEEKCNGCGQCIIACAEGALELVDGKAKLVADVYCDGLGACIGDCPEGALTVIERDAVEFDEAEVEKMLEKRAAEAPDCKIVKVGPAEDKLPCGCPSSATMTLKRPEDATGNEQVGEIRSELGHWPLKLQLLNPQAPFLKNADLLLLADCTAAAYPSLHTNLLRGKAVAMGCPKLDNLEEHIAKLTQILETAQLKSLTVVHMEVPCCKGFVYAAEKAIEQAGVDLPLGTIIIGRTGEILSREEVACKAAS